MSGFGNFDVVTWIGMQSSEVIRSLFPRGSNTAAVTINDGLTSTDAVPSIFCGSYFYYSRVNVPHGYGQFINGTGRRPFDEPFIPGLQVQFACNGDALVYLSGVLNNVTVVQADVTTGLTQIMVRELTGTIRLQKWSTIFIIFCVLLHTLRFINNSHICLGIHRFVPRGLGCRACGCRQRWSPLH
jgi:hypothetical protein